MRETAILVAAAIVWANALGLAATFATLEYAEAVRAGERAAQERAGVSEHADPMPASNTPPSLPESASRGRSARDWAYRDRPTVHMPRIGLTGAVAASPIDPVLSRKQAYIALHRPGWPSEQIENAVCVCERESNLRTAPSHTAGDPFGGSHGLCQVNGFWATPRSLGGPYPWFTDRYGFYNIERGNRDVLYHLRYGLAIWVELGWGEWGTARACGLL